MQRWSKILFGITLSMYVTVPFFVAYAIGAGVSNRGSRPGGRIDLTNADDWVGIAMLACAAVFAVSNVSAFVTAILSWRRRRTYSGLFVLAATFLGNLLILAFAAVGIATLAEGWKHR